MVAQGSRTTIMVVAMFAVVFARAPTIATAAMKTSTLVTLVMTIAIAQKIVVGDSSNLCCRWRGLHG